MGNLRERLVNSKRIVVKVGTSTLTYETGKANLSRIDLLARTIADLMNRGREVVLVTSGAIALGVGKLKMNGRPKTVRERQAAAAIGQCELMNIYNKLFSEYGYIVGQILLTKDVVEDGHRRENAVNTFETLLENGVVPVVNENDSVSIDELEFIDEHRTFGDNDTLSAMVAELIRADLLIILSDIDGFYDSDPRENDRSEMLSVIEKITPEIEQCAGGAGTSRGTGGMATKLTAAKIATGAGIDMVLANGQNPKIILDILDGRDEGTLFISEKGAACHE